MKFKKFLITIIAGISLLTVTSTYFTNQSVEAATTNTVPKKFRGKWYEKGYGQYYILQYTAHTQASYTTKTKKSLISGLREPVTVKKTGKNKCTVWSKYDSYKPHLTIKSITYNGKKYKMLIFKRGKGAALYYFNHKINRFYSPNRGFIN
ncbi:hypothetical protein OZX69_00230 [Lactobacillus sp. ESL0731]|uniref:hypothetical protein n=1 Tax=unclassified Lactobacillus TaxID=2620435 RepID=UPI0023F71E99|nr:MULTISPECIES: hypothetical protein [unclassified Lactobacillus]WEV51191.1 hypothetical protein OZX63_00230 [Lactobacillus sp. ESL0700]WEV62321.1 hypothetical protein OZX69_00230 [Lactobacillus sp. ESL0731]